MKYWDGGGIMASMFSHSTGEPKNLASAGLSGDIPAANSTDENADVQEVDAAITEMIEDSVRG